MTAAELLPGTKVRWHRWPRHHGEVLWLTRAGYAVCRWQKPGCPLEYEVAVPLAELDPGGP